MSAAVLHVIYLLKLQEAADMLKSSSSSILSEQASLIVMWE